MEDRAIVCNLPYLQVEDLLLKGYSFLLNITVIGLIFLMNFMECLLVFTFAEAITNCFVVKMLVAHLLILLSLRRLKTLKLWCGITTTWLLIRRLLRILRLDCTFLFLANLCPINESMIRIFRLLVLLWWSSSGWKSSLRINFKGECWLSWLVLYGSRYLYFTSCCWWYNLGDWDWLIIRRKISIGSSLFFIHLINSNYNYYNKWTPNRSYLWQSTSNDCDKFKRLYIKCLF